MCQPHCHRYGFCSNRVKDTLRRLVETCTPHIAMAARYAAVVPDEPNMSRILPTSIEPAFFERFRPSECIDNSLLLVALERMNRGEARMSRLLAELIIWALSIVIRASMAVFTIVGARTKTCSKANRFLLFAGVFLFTMHRVREFADLILTYFYYETMFLHCC